MVRFVVMTWLAVGFVLFDGPEATACLQACACLDADGDDSADDLVCCGAEAVTGLDAVEDGLAEGQSCGYSSGVAGPLSDRVLLAGRISQDGIQGCGCIDVDADGEAEITETIPPGLDCAATAAAACLEGHDPPERECATIYVDACGT